MNETSAKKTCRIILSLVDVDAVAITNRSKILAHVGRASDHHFPGNDLQTDAAMRVIQTGHYRVARSAADIRCSSKGCPLQAAIIMPLFKGKRVVGTLKLYFTSSRQIDSVKIELAQGLARLFSHQLELSEIDRQARLLQEAEIRSLQAQISPHFLFNSLNTISALCRIDPETARHLLAELSQYLRHNIHSAVAPLIPLEKEIMHARAYLAIEQARYSDRLHVEIRVNGNVNHVRVPPLILQPLIENAVKHGLEPGRETGIIMIDIREVKAGLSVMIRDNGKGMDETQIQHLLKKPGKTTGTGTGTGTGLYNVHQRLIGRFGERSGLKIKSRKGAGTTVSFWIPGEERGENDVDPGDDRGRRSAGTG